MLKIENSATKKIRVAQIVLFLIQIFLTTTPYIWAGRFELETKSSYTPFELVTYIGGSDETTQIGLICSIFLIIPIIALGFQIFDRQYNLKNVVGLICSFLGVFAITYIIGPAYICYGGIFALLLYLVTFFLSVMGIFARYLKTK